MASYSQLQYYHSTQGCTNQTGWVGPELHYGYFYPPETSLSQTPYNCAYEALLYHPNYTHQPSIIQDTAPSSLEGHTYYRDQAGDTLAHAVIYDNSDACAQTATPHLLPPAHAQVKEEPLEQGGYFSEPTPSPSRSPTPLPQCDFMPPNDLPLRATGAPPEMKKMMGVFRVNPFAYGRSGAVSTLYDGPAHPLEKEPEMFEFQIELWDAPTTEPLEDDELEFFTPEPDSVTLHHPYDHFSEEKQASPQLASEYNYDSSQLLYPSSSVPYLGQTVDVANQSGQSPCRRHSLSGYVTYAQIHNNQAGYMF